MVDVPTKYEYYLVVKEKFGEGEIDHLKTINQKENTQAQLPCPRNQINESDIAVTRIQEILFLTFQNYISLTFISLFVTLVGS